LSCRVASRCSKLIRAPCVRDHGLDQGEFPCGSYGPRVFYAVTWFGTIVCGRTRSPPRYLQRAPRSIVPGLDPDQSRAVSGFLMPSRERCRLSECGFLECCGADAVANPPTRHYAACRGGPLWCALF